MDFNEHVSLSAVFKEGVFSALIQLGEKNYFILFWYCHITANLAEVYDSER